MATLVPKKSADAHETRLRSVVLLVSARIAGAQAPGVPVYAEGRGARPNAALTEQAKKLQGDSELLSMTKVLEQAQRAQCDIVLPPQNRNP